MLKIFGWRYVLLNSEQYLSLIFLSRFSRVLPDSHYCFPSIFSDHHLLFLLLAFPHLDFQLWHHLGLRFLANSPLLFALFRVISYTLRILPLSWLTWIYLFQFGLLPTLSHSYHQLAAGHFCTPVHTHNRSASPSNFTSIIFL